MYDSFGKIHAIFISTGMLFLIPLLLFMQRQENLHQMYLLTEASYLVDAVRNTGKLTGNMYEEFEQNLMLLGKIYESELEHFHITYRREAGEVIRQEEYIGSLDIKQALKEEGVYQLEQGDFFRVQVNKIGHSLSDTLLYFLTGYPVQEESVFVYYGGSVRYEVD